MNFESDTERFFRLIQISFGVADCFEVTPDAQQWMQLLDECRRQTITGVIYGGLNYLPEEQRPSKELLLQWIGETLQKEAQSTIQQKTTADMALLFHHNSIRTYVLKGMVVAECYPTPSHRYSADMDCFLLPESRDFDAWALGNEIIMSKGFEIDTSYYKNSTFYLPGLTVENHRFLTPFRGNSQLKKLEKLLQVLLQEDQGEDRFVETWLYRPPVMVTSLFLIEHAYSHFLHEGLTWRHVLDWMLFSRNHKDEIDWVTLDAFIDEFGFRRFYDSYYHLGQYLLGEASEDDLAKLDKKMLEDVWAELDLHETVRGFKGKLALVGNTWRAQWKYRFFSKDNMLKALWIQVKGFVFIKDPKLN